ncbi:hypothetical protein RvY_00680 [Ramazzottius varieornatus]|uniref:Methyltransferase domain-containing protein n=1 Tax=Ramazzottius varieornatus TaxID=947166 RepID=A0A1D1UJV1_RAMVA|nr:hypothetical protein RvY_00680 [Ramazzottius varieornatus]
MDPRNIGEWNLTEEDAYLERALGFIIRYKWLHDFKITRFYVDNIHENLPQEWVQASSGLSTEELQTQLDVLRNSSSTEVRAGFPESLRMFLREAKDLCLKRAMLGEGKGGGALELESEHEVDIPRRLMYGMRPKKLHEVSRMAVLIHQICQKYGLRTVLDLGAGMGYLDCVLAEVYAYQVIAVESDGCRTVNAQRRLSRHSQKDRPISNLLKYEALTIDHSPGSLRDLREVLNKYGASLICIIGLHCCGSFTPIILDLFARLDEGKALVCVGCCYHLMRYSKNQSGVEHCPLSKMAKQKLEGLWTKPGPLLTTASLRLATQETKVRWLKELDVHVSCHHFRAVLELAACSRNYEIKKRRRHTSPEQYGSDADKFLATVFTDYQLIGYGHAANRTNDQSVVSLQ